MSHLYILIYLKTIIIIIIIIIIIFVVTLRNWTLTGVDSDRCYPNPLVQLLLSYFVSERNYCNPLYTIRQCGFKEQYHMLEAQSLQYR